MSLKVGDTVPSKYTIGNILGVVSFLEIEVGGEIVEDTR